MKAPFVNQFIRLLGSALRTFFLFIWSNMRFSEYSRRNARLGLLITIGVLAVAIGAFIPLGFHPLLDPLIGVVLSLTLAGLGGAAFLLAFRIIHLIPRFFKDMGVLLMGSIIVYMALFFTIPVGGILALVVVIFESLFFSGLFYLIFGNYRSLPLRMRSWIFIATVLGLTFNVYVVYWIQLDGTNDYLVDLAKVRSKSVGRLDIENPAAKGEYRVREISYGSQNIRNRPEYSRQADIYTPTVDGSAFVDTDASFQMKIRKMIQGFDLEHMPLNGMVWYPDVPGTFPLVLIVHGNHNMAEFSDPGYEYLGRHLASKGYIAVSVDENFLNGSSFGGLSNENDARAWVLLQHLKLWHQWNRTDNHRFFNLVDTTQIALIGHSRGGEAAAIAGNFNTLPYYPDDATVAFNFNYNIRSIVAIAPSNAQYSPGGKDNRLHNVNYFTIQGAHDADVSIFMGMRQYHDTRIENPNLFKASVYSYRSNHGQFNSVWGNTDYGWPRSFFLNKKPLLDQKEQQKLAKVYITGFLETTLKNKKVYRSMFADHRKIKHLLPEDIYITRFEDHSFMPFCTFEEDVDVTTGTPQHIRVEGSDLAVWKEHKLSFRGSGDKDNNALTLGWRADSIPKDSLQGGAFDEIAGEAAYTIHIDPVFQRKTLLDSTQFLAFSAANTQEELPEEDKGQNNGEENNKTKDKASNEAPGNTPGETGKDSSAISGPVQVDFSIRLADSDGDEATLPLSHFGYIPPVLKSKFLKLKMANQRYGDEYEVTLQDFRLPLKAFIKKNPAFDPSQLHYVAFVFDRTEEGMVVIDRIGIEQ